ncbi:MAG: sigma 54-interacting transcriptional regulator, partial [Proteobacteria bacterium]|nr:sigma 54-interacting transcriptional regulator [Pseudomonadota bacterium]
MADINLIKKIKIFDSLKTTLLLTVAFLVVFTGIVVSQLVIQNYSTSLLAGAIAKAESIAHKLSLDVTDKILINDLVAVQKILDDQIISEPSVSYLFIINNKKVLVHTFPDGIPVNLVNIKTSPNKEGKNIVKVISDQKERFIDIQLPIFEGKAGVLRLGISEKPHQDKANQLRVKMTLITFGVLVVSLFLSHLFISHLLQPLIALTNAVKNIDEDKLDSKIDVRGRSEVTKLAVAYNAMMERIRDYTTKLKTYNLALKQKNKDLDRAHNQLMTTFSVAQQITALPNLRQISSFLIKTLHEIVECSNMVMVIFNTEKKIPYLATEKDYLSLDEKHYDALFLKTNQIDGTIFLKKDQIQSLPLPEKFKKTQRMAIFPFHYHMQVLGAIFIACPDDCVCVKTEMDVIHLILKQTSSAIHRASEHEKEIQGLKNSIEKVSGYEDMIGKDSKIQIIYKLIDDVAPTDATVLIQGESGTGKEMVAKAIHNRSGRSNMPFIVINCSAYPATLLESELFGHEKGAFTGALHRKIGRFEQAKGGSVFLDEIGEISPSAQTMLLRVLQSQKIERIGGENSIKVNTRVLAATNRNLIDDVNAGRFREDLF